MGEHDEPVRLKGVAELGGAAVWKADLRSAYGVFEASEMDSFILRTEGDQRVAVDLSSLGTLSAVETSVEGQWRELKERDEVRGTFDAGSVPDSAQVIWSCTRIREGDPVEVLGVPERHFPEHDGNLRTAAEPEVQRVKAHAMAAGSDASARMQAIVNGVPYVEDDSIPAPPGRLSKLQRIHPSIFIIFFALATPFVLLCTFHKPRDPGGFIPPFSLLGVFIGAGAFKLIKKLGQDAHERARERDEGEWRSFRLRSLIGMFLLGGLMFTGMLRWSLGTPDANEGAVHVRDTEAGTWTLDADSWALDPATCAHPAEHFAKRSYDSVFVRDSIHWLWVQPQRVTVGVSEGDGKARAAEHARPQDCSRFEVSLQQSRRYESLGIDGDRLGGVSGQVHLTCELPSGGTVEADMELHECATDTMLRPLDTLDRLRLPEEWQELGLLQDNLMSWDATLKSASGVELAQGSSCEILTDISTHCGERERLVLVQCDEQTLYHWSAPGDGRVDRECTLYEQQVEAGYRYWLKCHDLGSRTGRPHMRIDTLEGTARIFREDGSLDVRLAVDSPQALRKSDSKGACPMLPAPPLTSSYQWAGTVERLEGALPLEIGQQCELTVVPHDDGPLLGNCKVGLECHGRMVYDGWTTCIVDDTGRFAAIRDDELAETDTTPMLEVDVQKRTLLLTRGRDETRATVELSLAEEADTTSQ